MGQVMSVVVKSLAVGLLSINLTVSAAENEVEVSSEQIRSPVMTAFGSAVTFAAWPARFGEDLAPVPAMHAGWSAAQAAALLPHAQRRFESARKMWWALFGVIAGIFLYRSKKMKKRFFR